MPQPKPKKTERYGIFLIPSFTVLAVFVGGCWLANFALSFTKFDGFSTPEFVGLQNYAWLVQSEDFWRAFGNAFIFIVPMALIPTAIGVVLAALLFEVLNTPATRKILSFVRSVIYLPQIFSLMITGVVWSGILANSGVLNTMLINAGLDKLTQDWTNVNGWAMFWLCLIMVWIQLGYTVVIFLAGLVRIDPAILEAASVDGANWRQRFRSITVFQLIPELLVVLLVTTVGALKVFGPVYFVTHGGPFGYTIVPTLFSFTSFFGGNNVGYGSAVSTLLSLIIAVIALMLLRLQRKSLFAEMN